MGHAIDLVAQTGFPGDTVTSPGPSNSNYRDVPVNVVPTITYSTVQVPPLGLAGGWIKAPKFIQNFDSDGGHAVILDIQHAGTGNTAINPERWVLDSVYALKTSTYNNITLGVTSTQNWYCSTRFTYLTPGAESQSLFYNFGRDDARMLPQQVVPLTQPQGTSATLVWQGAKADTTNVNNPDLTTLTPWVADVRTLSTYRFIRFRVSMTNNVHSGAVPAIDSILMPYTFK